ncbi:unnamed protein product [Gemmataceae bacterium]|nr:unnamed protein product [Gemmataceae bacterium]VTU00107.1 unnamed protein product [Gemmataceae bacterium]
MRILPHTLFLMSLRGRMSIYGRPLPTPAEAVEGLRQMTGQDFGLDADQWAAWFRANPSWRRTRWRGAINPEQPN